MTATDERQAVNELAAQSGWQRNEHDRVNVYLRGSACVHVVWRGAGAISGGSRYDDEVLSSYTRDLAKIQGWLTG